MARHGASLGKTASSVDCAKLHLQALAAAQRQEYCGNVQLLPPERTWSLPQCSSFLS